MAAPACDAVLPGETKVLMDQWVPIIVASAKTVPSSRTGGALGSPGLAAARGGAAVGGLPLPSEAAFDGVGGEAGCEHPRVNVARAMRAARGRHGMGGLVIVAELQAKFTDTILRDLLLRWELAADFTRWLERRGHRTL